MPRDTTNAAAQPRWGAVWLGTTTEVALWAPAAATVLLEREGGALLPLQPTGEGWHSATVADLPPGTRYRFVADGCPVPDPAARAQPDGPAGFSAVTDPDAYRWGDAAWHGRPWTEAVVYELHVDTFSAAGTFKGAIAHLDHLVRLGVTVVELMPVATFPGQRNWGYDGVLPFAPDHTYGTPDELKQLVDACHQRGIAVLLDVVYNHFGPAENHIPGYAPTFFNTRHTTPWGGAINFDGRGSPAVRAFFKQNALYWVGEFHMDGLRLDAVQAMFDDSQVHILDEIARAVHDAHPGRIVHLTLENDGNEARWLGQGGRLYRGQWNDDFHHVGRVLVCGQSGGYYEDYVDAPADRLGRALTEGFSFQGEESRHRPGLVRGTPSAHLPPTAFINFLQNHDQVGNSAYGRRLTAQAPDAAVRLGTAVLLLSPGIPMLFMGQEWGSARPFDFFCDYPPPLCDAVREGRREEFRRFPEFHDPAALDRLADPNAEATRDASVLDWDVLDQPAHAAWLAFHTRLLAIRRDRIVPLLPRIGGGAGSYRTLGPQREAADRRALEARWRLGDGRTLLLAANFSDGLVDWQAPEGEVLFRAVPKPGRGLAAWDGAVILLG